MSFWTLNPIKLFDNLSIIPNLSQSYDQRLNALTRLVIFIAIVLYIFKFKEFSFHFLIFGIITLIIIFYSQKDQKMSKESFMYATTPVGKIMYDVNNGKGNPEYWRETRDPPSLVDANQWGGYHTHLNVNNPMQLPQGYESNLQWGERNNVTFLKPVNPLPVYQESNERFLNPPNWTSSPSRNQNDYHGSVGILGGGTTNVYTGAPLPFNLNVEGRDERFINGNEYYLHRQIPSSTQPNYYPQPLNRGGGIELNTRNNFNPHDLGNIPYYDPSNIPKARTEYQKQMYNQENMTGRYRLASTLGDKSNDVEAGGYQNVGDLRGNNQYYLTNYDPFAGLFAMNSNTFHLDVMSANGDIRPMYKRNGMTSDNYVEALGEIQMADEMLFRDSMTEAAVNKFGETEFQYRMGPVRHA